MIEIVIHWPSFLYGVGATLVCLLGLIGFISIVGTHY